MLTKMVKCIDNTNRHDYLKLGKVYEVESQRDSSDGGIAYYLKGVSGSHAKRRFEDVTHGIGVICVDDSNSEYQIVKGGKYVAYQDPNDREQYIIQGTTPNYWLKERFILDDSASQLAKQPIAKVVDDKAAELAFFKRRPVGNECPCGGVRGVCPDHR